MHPEHLSAMIDSSVMTQCLTLEYLGEKGVIELADLRDHLQEVLDRLDDMSPMQLHSLTFIVEFLTAIVAKKLSPEERRKMFRSLPDSDPKVPE